MKSEETGNKRQTQNTRADRIDLHLIDAASGLSGNNTFVFRGTGTAGVSAAGAVSYARFDTVGTANDYTLVYLDTDRDTGAEAVIRLSGLHVLSAADFVL